MKINKKLVIIISIVILIGSMGLIYKSTSSVPIKESTNLNGLNETKKLEKKYEETLLSTQELDELPIYDSSKTQETISKPVSTNIVENKKIPILMYHSISYEKGNTLRVSKENFRNQMKYIKNNNYTALTLDELYSYMQKGGKLPTKPIVITFDDGYIDNYTNAYPILKEFKIKATMFVITNTIDKEENYLTSNQLRLMDLDNIRIESHTVAHEHLDKIPYEDNVKTMKASKIKLEKILNRKINYISYPYGGYTESTIKAAKQTGYILAFSTEFGWIGKNDNIYSLGRIFVNSNYNLEQFKAKLNS
ncbi:polysaccharide deacetylase family protein [Clostridium sp.]|uniref:polysaccharide deacetylase family protein n=1 Tax=Clostridium sp. TaxID=1506 RepID=UPI001A5FC416|nr:polysaccharide deacetylase family protein [Clostridium sp.]MBK5236220.1 polysaccharide deacetylase family protein [Clostridium sp.]